MPNVLYAKLHRFPFDCCGLCRMTQVPLRLFGIIPFGITTCRHSQSLFLITLCRMAIMLNGFTPSKILSLWRLLMCHPTLGQPCWGIWAQLFCLELFGIMAIWHKVPLLSVVAPNGRYTKRHHTKWGSLLVTLAQVSSNTETNMSGHLGTAI